MIHSGSSIVAVEPSIPVKIALRSIGLKYSMFECVNIDMQPVRQFDSGIGHGINRCCQGTFSGVSQVLESEHCLFAWVSAFTV